MANDKKLKALDLRLIDDLFEMGGGYVLDFSNRTFSEFFQDELGVNIDDAKYEVEGTSKAKRLRYFLRTVSVNEVVKTLLALWDYRETLRRRSGAEEKYPEHKIEFFQLIERLGGKPPESIKQKTSDIEKPKVDDAVVNDLYNELVNLNLLEPQPRGYAFEKFLKKLFDAYGLSGRASFRITGEQIDGSLEFSGETYLLEAKWQNKPADAADLRSFNGKVEDKASWSRGLFVSYSGFSDEGLIAFGRGKKVVCMDGYDLSEILHNKLSFIDVLSKKVRRAAETGKPFVPIRDLFS